ncbi:DoxX family protein [Nocardioides sp. NPDC101246]|uniref:DoxX family protein n=1 Tax=Nocardioides sp. NPDC101246 TaxID=3364336 RepID=UPI00382EE9B8
MVDLGLLILRLVLAALLVGHSMQKLAGWFQGMGPARTGEVFETWGFRPGRPMAVLAGVCELVGALLIATGLLTPLGCAIVIGTMIVAASPNAANGLWAHLGGCEVPVVYALIAAVLAITGPGAYALDEALGLPAEPWTAAAAIALGVLASIPPLLRRRPAPNA